MISNHILRKLNRSNFDILMARYYLSEIRCHVGQETKHSVAELIDNFCIAYRIDMPHQLK
jgi:hypothetical protein